MSSSDLIEGISKFNNYFVVLHRCIILLFLVLNLSRRHVQVLGPTWREQRTLEGGSYHFFMFLCSDVTVRWARSAFEALNPYTVLRAPQGLGLVYRPKPRGRLTYAIGPTPSPSGGVENVEDWRSKPAWERSKTATCRRLNDTRRRKRLNMMSGDGRVCQG